MRCLFASIALSAACGEEGTVARVSFAAEAHGAASGPLEIDTPSGWHVRLETARISIGPIYFRNIKPNAGGVEDEGRVIAQVLAQFTVDALDPTPRTIEGGGLGTSEPTLSAEVRLAEAADGPIAEAFGIRSAIAQISGVATKTSSVVSFEGSFRVLKTGSDFKVFRDHRLTGVPADIIPDQGGTLSVIVDASHWVDSVVFDRLVSGSLDSPAALGQLRAGVVSRAAFSFNWSP